MSICSHLEATIGILKLGTVKYCSDLGRKINRSSQVSRWGDSVKDASIVLFLPIPLSPYPPTSLPLYMYVSTPVYVFTYFYGLTSHSPNLPPPKLRGATRSDTGGE